MYSLTLRHGPPSRFVTRIANLLKTEVNEDDSVLIKNHAANGYFKAVTLENGIQCLCANYKANEDFHLHKMPLSYQYYILRINEISHSHNTLMMAGRKYSVETLPKNFSVLLLSSSDKFSFLASEKSQVKSLEILMPRQWFFNQLTMDCSDENVKKFLKIRALKSGIDSKIDIYKKSFHKIIEEANKDILDTICIEENVNKILQSFFPTFTSNLKSFLEIDKVKISTDEVSRLMAVKKRLEQPLNFSQPSFSSLTKIALMSGTTLKTKFKKMFGASVFQYFQRIRMEKARILLLTHKFSVKQVGLQLGYTNMNNFTIAFKKEFNQLPSELI